MTTAKGRAAHSRYAEVISMWVAKFDTSEIAAQLAIKEPEVARWVANYQDVMHAN
jgi:hypothetical protein